jgi:hypothetical protein
MDVSGATTGALRRRRRVLLGRLSALDAEVIRGSLIETYKRCGKTGCVCMSSKGHGPKYYLTLTLPGGKLDSIYVPQNCLQAVRRYVCNYHCFQEQFKQLCDINRELLRRHELL